MNADASENPTQGAIHNPQASKPQDDGRTDSSVTEETKQQRGTPQRNDAGHQSNCCIVCKFLAWPFIYGWKHLKARSANQWLAIGTWVLAAVTVGVLIESMHSSERQLRAYVGVLDHQIENVSEGSIPKITFVFRRFPQAFIKALGQIQARMNYADLGLSAYGLHRL